MQSLIKDLACGNVTERSKQPAVDFTVTNLPDILEKIMPFCSFVERRIVERRTEN
jgi:hypothetical protein